MGNATVFAQFSVSIDFAPLLTPVAQTAYGPACGLAFVVTDVPLTQHNLSLDVTNAFALSPVLFVFGARRASIPIHGTPCTLLTEIVAAVGISADAAGHARWEVALPGPLQSAPIDVQPLAYDAALQIRTGHGVEVQFVD